MKSKIIIMALVLTVVVGVTSSQATLPQGYEPVRIVGKSLNETGTITSFKRITLNGDVKPFEIPPGKMFVITDIDVMTTETYVGGTIMILQGVSLVHPERCVLFAGKIKDKITNYIMTTGFAVAYYPEVMRAILSTPEGSSDEYTDSFIILRGYLMTRKLYAMKPPPIELPQ